MIFIAAVIKVSVKLGKWRIRRLWVYRFKPTSSPQSMPTAVQHKQMRLNPQSSWKAEQCWQRRQAARALLKLYMMSVLHKTTPQQKSQLRRANTFCILNHLLQNNGVSAITVGPMFLTKLMEPRKRTATIPGVEVGIKIVSKYRIKVCWLRPI